MKVKSVKGLAMTLVLFVAMTMFTGCNSKYGGLPNGRYENTANADSVLGTQAISAIIIDGGNYMQEILGVAGQTWKYKYKNGTVTFYQGAEVISMPCEYKNGAISLSGMTFEKVK